MSDMRTTAVAAALFALISVAMCSLSFGAVPVVGHAALAASPAVGMRPPVQSATGCQFADPGESMDDDDGDLPDAPDDCDLAGNCGPGDDSIEI